MSTYFSDAVTRSLKPLFEKYGLSCVRSDEQIVRFENSSVWVAVHYDSGRSGELGVEIGQIGAEDAVPPFSLEEVLRCVGVLEARSIEKLATGDERQMSDTMDLLAGLLRTHAEPFLSGDGAMYAKVQSHRWKEGSEYAIATVLKRAREKAHEAWTSGDYWGVVRAFGEVEAHLSPAESKRLEYCRKRAVRG